MDTESMDKHGDYNLLFLIIKLQVPFQNILELRQTLSK